MAEEDAAAHRASYTTRIEQAIRSSDPDRVLEGEIALAVAGDLVDFNGRTATQDITNAGALVVRTQEDLLRVLATL